MTLGLPKWDITPSDFDDYQVWYCEHGNEPEVDFVYIPVTDVHEVTKEICRRGNPGIPLCVEDTNWCCFSYYDVTKNTIFGAAIWMVDEWRGFNCVDAPRTPVTLVSRVPILGVPDRRFCIRKPDDWYAEAAEAA
jgi:hypothetical protein